MPLQSVFTMVKLPIFLTLLPLMAHAELGGSHGGGDDVSLETVCDFQNDKGQYLRFEVATMGQYFVELNQANSKLSSAQGNQSVTGFNTDRIYLPPAEGAWEATRYEYRSHDRKITVKIFTYSSRLRDEIKGFPKMRGREFNKANLLLEGEPGSIDGWCKRY